MENNFQEDIGKIIAAIKQLYNISIKKKQTMPTPSLAYENQIVLYIGETDSNYVKNTFYRCKQNGLNYVWTISNSSTEQAIEAALELTCLKTETTDPVIDDAITHNAIDYTIYGNTGGVGDEVTIEGATKYIIPVKVSGKNIWDSNLIQGYRRFTDGTKLNDNVYGPLYVTNENPISVKEGETYTISANNYNSPSDAGFVFFKDGVYVSKHITNSFTTQIPNGVNQLYYNFRIGNIRIYPDTFSNIQLEANTISTNYEPYREPTITNIYLDAPLAEGESASLSTTNTQIPLIKNSNIIEFETTVQPSSFKFKYYQDINKVLEKQKAELQALILNQ